MTTDGDRHGYRVAIIRTVIQLAWSVWTQLRALPRIARSAPWRIRRPQSSKSSISCQQRRRTLFFRAAGAARLNGHVASHRHPTRIQACPWFASPGDLVANTCMGLCLRSDRHCTSALITYHVGAPNSTRRVPSPHAHFRDFVTVLRSPPGCVTPLNTEKEREFLRRISTPRFELHRHLPRPFAKRAERTKVDSRPRGACPSIRSAGCWPNGLIARWSVAGNTFWCIPANRQRRAAGRDWMGRRSARPPCMTPPVGLMHPTQQAHEPAGGNDSKSPLPTKRRNQTGNWCMKHGNPGQHWSFGAAICKPRRCSISRRSLPKRPG